MRSLKKSIMIDIFVLDNVCVDERYRNDTRRFHRYRKGMERTTFPYSAVFRWNRPRSYVRTLLTFLSKCLGPAFFLRRIDSLIARHAEDARDKLVIWDGDHRVDRVFDPAWFADFYEVPFEGRAYLAPCGWRNYLEAVYGDYMQLPPVEQRQYTHDIDVFWLKDPADAQK